MSNSEKYIKNSIRQSGGASNGTASNTPTQYASRQKQYYDERTRRFIGARAQYSSDFVKAQVQGYFADDFYRYVTTDIRFSDIASQTASATKLADDTKIVLFQEPSFDYFPIGAKIQTMGNTWICTNPSNMSSVHSTAVVQRCNTAYNLYDYYGNIVSEPIIVEKATMSANDNDTSQNLVLMEGYFNVIAQLNEYTKLLNQNKRIILGSKAYEITGYTDFIQEFTADYDSVHLLRFSIRIDEPQTNDDLINHIANGKNQTFYAVITGQQELQPSGDLSLLTTSLNVNLSTGELLVNYNLPHNGTNFYLENAELISENTINPQLSEVKLNNGAVTATVFNNSIQLYAHFIKNDMEVQSTTDYPITWNWTSLNPEICAVNANGEIVGISSGTAVIVATLAQNTAISAQFSVTVEEAQVQPSVRFVGVVPESLEQYDGTTIQAGYYQDNVLTAEPITWSFSGARTSSYKVTYSADNTIKIMCLQGDSTPLTVTASYGGESVSAEIRLEGY